MSSLQELIDKYSQPDILLDSCISSRQKYAAWGFEEIIEINDQGCFLNNELVDGDYFEIIQNTICRWKNESNHEIACIGFISYEFKKFIYEYIQFSKNSDQKFPYLWFCKPKIVKEFLQFNTQNHIDGKLKFIDDIMSLNDYTQKINTIKKYLKDGDVYQINFTDFKKMDSTFKNSFELYVSLREQAQPHEGFFLNTDQFDILSLSPESLIKVQGKKIYTSPIKGTRPRGKTPNEDCILKQDLQNSIKDKAEHLMIVDLLRNDLGKICEIDSISVQNLYKVKSFNTIHHMVSDIQGNLKHSVSEMDIMKALFPGGSITGAPKESAMSIIDDLETSMRRIYTGSAGYIKSNGNMSFNICIRTLLKIGSEYQYGVGGGIVWDSVAIEEWNEAHQKSKILDPLI